jgi:ABC-type sugar transport system ATPase subunit
MLSNIFLFFNYGKNSGFYYGILLDFKAAQGMCIIFISSELPEIMALSDRILVLFNGKVKGEFLPEKTTKDELLVFACG